MTIDQKAPVVTRDQELINAPIDTLWPIFTNVSGWTRWNKDIDQAYLEGPLQTGSTIYWTTAGMDIVSTIGELVPAHHIIWSGLTQGITGIHSWQFTPVAGGTLVQTEESWSGEPVEAYPATMQQDLNQFLRRWLTSLKQAAESARY